MSGFAPVIKWSGSKRSQANQIVSFAPNKFNCYYEPFVGGGSVLYALNPRKGICGDICEPLVGLWNQIKDSPEKTVIAYELRWTRLQEEGYQVFNEIRDNFNLTHDPADLLFLSRTCVNGLIRFNSKGEFNNTFHHTRPGIHPERFKKIIFDWSHKVQGLSFVCKDYRETTGTARKGDLIYLDPPYFHTKGRYYGKIDYDEFVNFLEELNKKGIKFMLSLDGVRGDDDFTMPLPKELYKRHVFISSGNSSFKKVMNKESLVVNESLYLNY